MIVLTKLNGKDIMLNEEQIENVVESPDTVVNMVNGNSYIVQESLKEIMGKIVAFHRACNMRSLRGSGSVEN